MIKNKNYIVALFLCLLLPGVSYGMAPGRIVRIKPKTPVKTSEKSIPKPIQKYTEKETTTPSTPSEKTRTGTTGKPQLKPGFQPSLTSAFQQLHPSEWVKIPQSERIATEMLLENGELVIQEAREHGLDVEKKYELALNLINNIETENIESKDIEALLSQLTDLFSRLEVDLTKKLVLELKKLIKDAQEIGIKEETLEPFEKIAKEFSGNIADELLIYSKDEINKALSDLKQHIEMKEIKTRIKATEKESTKKTAEEQKKQAETKKLQTKIEAAEQKAIEQQAQLAEEKLKKEIDSLYKQIEKEETVILEQMAEDFIAKEEQKKQLEREQEKAIDEAEEERLRTEIAETEAEMDQLERKREERKLEVEQLKQKMAEQEAALEIEIKKELEAIKRKNELERLTAAEKVTKPVTTEPLKIEEATKIQQPVEEIKEEKIKEEAKPEEIKEKETEKKEEKEKTRSDGGGQIPPTQEYPERKEEKKEKEQQKVPLQPTLPKKPIVPAEKEVKIAEVTPEITPEFTVLPQKEITPTIPETIEQHMISQTQPIIEEPTPSLAIPAKTTPARWPKPKMPGYTPETQRPPFIPSPSYGAGAPLTPESIGWTSTIGISPYTQRIELPPRVQPKEEKPAPEIKREKKVQPQDIVWWEKLLPEWIIKRLGRKDRAIKEKAKKVVPSAPITAPEEEKPREKEVSVVKTIIETIKKPIADTINYIRGLFYAPPRSF